MASFLFWICDVCGEGVGSLQWVALVSLGEVMRGVFADVFGTSEVLVINFVPWTGSVLLE